MKRAARRQCPQSITLGERERVDVGKESLLLGDRSVIMLGMKEEQEVSGMHCNKHT